MRLCLRLVSYRNRQSQTNSNETRRKQISLRLQIKHTAAGLNCYVYSAQKKCLPLRSPDPNLNQSSIFQSRKVSFSFGGGGESIFHFLPQHIWAKEHLYSNMDKRVVKRWDVSVHPEFKTQNPFRPCQSPRRTSLFGFCCRSSQWECQISYT